ncbi:flavoprotein [Nocardioides sp. dk4132]|uniref:flavoprotein n=1 Tax=unclassified Nocardioides TaxID=2615069 RepID=UPI0012962110|nr:MULTISPECIES: flavoprotein [unclassified Nocardioides]MQW77542.1 flavoprotein [Nocardioides sp. dk4132]QGA06076.1 flavoprotein [Nocardioides sp. dk884]
MSAEQQDPAEVAQAIEEAIAQLGGRRISLVVTGSLSAAYLPYWLNYLRDLRERPDLRVILTRSATTMVSRQVVTALLRAPVMIDSWDEAAPGHATHVELAETTDAFLVHPCTFSYLGRLAAGLADTPAQLAIQCSTAPLVVCPALPPGTLESAAYRRHLATLADRDALTVLPPVPGISSATGRREGLPPAPFPMALAAVAGLLADRDG